MIQKSWKNADIGENIFSMLAEIFINIIQVSCVLYILTRLVSEKVKTVFYVGGQRGTTCLDRCSTNLLLVSSIVCMGRSMSSLDKP